MVTGSLDYTIDVLPDRPPTVQFTKPGRDEKVLSVDEVYTEAKAEDDYGVAKLELVYSVNGSDERALPLHDGTRAIRDVSAGYTFMLEGLKLEPGDVVSYYARATDNNAVSGAQKASTDIYFMTVRPYENDYRQRQGGGGGGGGGGGQADETNQLSQKQRDIIAATFKTARDSALTDKKTLDENLATLRLSQQRLREQTSQLANRLVERGISTSDTNWAKIAEILPKAAAEMDSAEKKLTQGSPRAALQPEQRALQQLQRAGSGDLPRDSRSRWAAVAVEAAADKKPTPRISPISSSCKRIVCATSTRRCNEDRPRISSNSRLTIRSTPRWRS